MENGSELLTRKKTNIIENVIRIKDLDSTTSSLQPKKLRLRNEASSIMNFKDNISPKKLKDFPICFSLFTKNEQKNQESLKNPKKKEKIIDKKKFIIKEKEQEKSKNILNLKGIKTLKPNLNHLNLNDIIKPNNKKIISRNVNYFNSLSPKKSSNISSFIKFSPTKKTLNSSKINFNKVNNSPSSLILNKRPIIINQIGSNNSIFKLNTKFNNSNSTIEQDISTIKNIKGLSINNLNINFNDKKFIPSLFSTPKSESKTKNNIEKITKKQLINQMKRKIQNDINNFEIKADNKSISDEISKNDIDSIIRIKSESKHNTTINKNQNKLFEPYKDKENSNTNINLNENKINNMSNTFYKGSLLKNIGDKFNIKLNYKNFSTHKLEDKLNNYFKNKPNLLLNGNKEESNEAIIINNKLVENNIKLIEKNNSDKIRNNKDKIVLLSRLKKSSLKTGAKQKNKVIINDVKETEIKEEKEESKENKEKRLDQAKVKRKQTDYIRLKNDRKNDMISDNEKKNDDKDNNVDNIKRSKSTRVVNSKKLNLLKMKKNKFYLTICKKKVEDLYNKEKNKFLKKFQNTTFEIGTNRAYRTIFIKKTKMLLDCKDKADDIINNQRSYLQIYRNLNKQKNNVDYVTEIYYDDLLNNNKRRRIKYNENEINSFIMTVKFNCKICPCLYDSIITPIDFEGFPQGIMNIKSTYNKLTTNTNTRKNKKQRPKRKNFHTVKLKQLILPLLEKEEETEKLDNLERFSINKTKNTLNEELDWIYLPINLLSIQEIILRSNNNYYEKKNFRPSIKRRNAIKRFSQSLNTKRKDSYESFDPQLSMKKISNLNFHQLKKNLKKSAFNDFSVLNQKKFFKRVKKRKKRNATINIVSKKELKNYNCDNSSCNDSISDRLSSIENSHNLEDIYIDLLMSIIEGKNKQFLKQYEKYKNIIDINQRLIEGNTLLIICAREGNFAIAKFLCDKGIKVNIQNNNGNTALHYAIGNQFYSIADILTRHGAREDISNKRGLLPWDCIENNLE